MKQIRKEERRLKKEANSNNGQNRHLFNPELLREQREYALMTANMVPALQPRTPVNPELPFVFDTRMDIKQTAAYILGVKVTLPSDAFHVSKPGHEEHTIPATSVNPPEWTDAYKNISDLDQIGQVAFKGVKRIVYVTPMKALAAEMTKTFSKKLFALGITVKELTGDMQLTKQEISQTQMLVVTPEKWDVVCSLCVKPNEKIQISSSNYGPYINLLTAAPKIPPLTVLSLSRRGAPTTRRQGFSH
eukprot:sb/3468869/